MVRRRALSRGAVLPRVGPPASTRKRILKAAHRATIEVDVRIPRLAILDRSGGRSEDVIISLTTYPARLGSVHVTIESLLRQSTRPAQIILALSSRQISPHDLPRPLTRQVRRGLTIVWTRDDIRSYKKLLPAMELWPEVPIVTADDDVLYSAHWLTGLLQAHKQTPNLVIGHRASEMCIRSGEIHPYRTWPPVNSQTSPMRTFLTGMGGILYPVGALHPSVFDYKLAERLAPHADDIWFKAMALLRGTGARYAGKERPQFIPSWRASQKYALYHENLGSDRNDQQLRAVFSHFNLWDRLD
jgi:hypothetical protein